MGLRNSLRLAMPVILLTSFGCVQHVTCGSGTLAVNTDGRGGYIDQDGRGWYVNQDNGRRIKSLVCLAVVPATVCGVGTVVVEYPNYKINPDGRGYYADMDGRGLYVDQDGRGYYADMDGRGIYVDMDGRGRYIDQDDTVPAQRACVLGEYHGEVPADS